MPKELHDKLAKQAASRGLTGEKKDAYVYGTMRKTGWKPDRERKGNPTPTMRTAKMQQISTVKGVNLVRS